MTKMSILRANRTLVDAGFRRNNSHGVHSVDKAVYRGHFQMKKGDEEGIVGPWQSKSCAISCNCASSDEVHAVCPVGNIESSATAASRSLG